MIYYPDTSLDVRTNFALEYYLMTEKRPIEPVLLLWSTTPTVMLGKYQSAASELNLPFIRQHDIVVVRRMSGGGTIYTDQGGCQFTLITPDHGTEIDFSAGMELIQQALTAIGIQATTDSRNDLVVGNRKVSGNAQYLMPGFKLHHGSLLFDADLEQMTQSLKIDPVKQAAKHIQSVHQRTVNLKEQRPGWSVEDFKRRLLTALLSLTNAQTVHLTSADKQAIQVIAAKYFSEALAISDVTESYQHQHKSYFSGAGVVAFAFSLNAEQRFSKVKLTGDFFSNLPTERLESALLGKPYEPQVVTPIIHAQLAQDPIRGLNPEQMVSLIF